MSARAVAAMIVLAACLSSMPCRAEPAAFWFNDPVDPDDSVIVVGAELDAVSNVTIAPLAGHAAGRALEILQQNADSLKFVVPADFAKGAYRVTLSFPGGEISKSLNAPTVYWRQGDLGSAASAGGWLRIFGRNIARTRQARLRLTSTSGGRTFDLDSEEGDLWSARFRIPRDIPAGPYLASLFNGDAAEPPSADGGWIDIRAPAEAPGPRFDVKSFGGVGDGKSDDADALEAALTAARRAGGGVAFLPPGRYFLRRAISIPANVVLRGEGADRVSLLWPDFETPPPALISGVANFAVEDVTLYASNHADILVGGFSRRGPAPEAANIRFARVRIRASTYRGHLSPAETAARTEAQERIAGGPPYAIRLTGRAVSVVDCDVISSSGSLQLLAADGALIAGNRFGNGRLGGYMIAGSQRVIFEDNLIFSADLQSTGGGVNTLGRDAPPSENIYVHGNAFTSILGWDREAMTTDGPRGFYFGTLEIVDGRRRRLLQPLPEFRIGGNWAGAVVFVAAGKGRGQWAKVASAETPADPGRVYVTLDRDFAVPLDSTSLVSISPMQRNYLVIGNRFEDAGVAFQTYGTGLDHVIADNVSRRTGGLFLYGGYYRHFQPNWQIQLLSNRLEEGSVYRAGPNASTLSGDPLLEIIGDQDRDEDGLPPLARAIVVRDNDLGPEGRIEVRGKSRRSPGVRDVIVEGNVAAGRRDFVSIDAGSADVLERLNGAR